MIFEADPSDVGRLESKQLVSLLRRLLHAEALSASIPLSGVSVPLQITVPDGGEDGRISWQEGPSSTDYIPSRLSFFQSKASSIGAAGWKKECWTKGSQRKGKARVLTPALKKLAGDGGSYVGFTTEALGGAKLADAVDAIKHGIEEAGGDHAKLAAIRVYGANEIAAWVDRHPGVAVWLNELIHAENLGGFQSVESWGNRADFRKSIYVEDKKNRFGVSGRKGAADSLDALGARGRIAEHLAEPRRLVRLVGMSGLGKSRFVHEFIKDITTLTGAMLNMSAVFADYRSVGSSLLPLASRLSDSGLSTLLIVDECPRDVAVALTEIAIRESSRLRVITMDIDDQPIGDDPTLDILIQPSDDGLTRSLIKQLIPNAPEGHVQRFSEVAGGFPRFAMLAAGTGIGSLSHLGSMEEIVGRILSGSHVRLPEEVRALECLSLFEGLDTEPGNDASIDVVGPALARQSGDEMYEHLAKASQHEVVGRVEGRLQVQPLPIANFLARRRLDLLRPSAILNLLEGRFDLTKAAVRRWRYLDTSPTLKRVAREMLRPGGVLGTAEALLSPQGASLLRGLVHIAPDTVSDALKYLLLPLPLSDLERFTAGRRDLIEVLCILALPKATFPVAARMMLRLAAAENEHWGNNASGILKQLFHLQLSGTELPASQRLAILDEGLESGDERIVDACVEALSSIFETHYVRFGDLSQIGTRPPLTEWTPRVWEDIFGYFRGGLKRLSALRRQLPRVADRCERILIGAARSLLSSGIYEEYGKVIEEVAKEKGVWFDAIEAVGDWLYFDRSTEATEKSLYARALYDRLFPEGTVDKAILFTKFWSADIRDPNVLYSPEESDYGYSERMARSLARAIAADEELTRVALTRMLPLQLHGGGAFAEELIMHAAEKRKVMDFALTQAGGKREAVPFLRGLLSGLDRLDSELADEYLQELSSRPDIEGSSIDFYSAVYIGSARLDNIIAGVRNGSIGPAECIFLSYGRGLDDAPPSKVGELIAELGTKGSSGVWSGLQVAMMRRYGSDETMAPEVAAAVVSLLASPDLVSENRSDQGDEHLLNTVFAKATRTMGLSDEFSVGLLAQLVRLVKTDGYSMFSHLKGAMRRILGELVKEKPRLVWDRVSHFAEICTPAELSLLVQVVGSDPDNFSDSPQTGPGLLFSVPHEIVFDWADAYPARRAPFLVTFFPTLSAEAPERWSSAFEELAQRYGKHTSFRVAIEDRIRPRSWSGSIVPLLEVYLSPLESWFAHETDALAAWAREERNYLQRRIDQEVTE